MPSPLARRLCGFAAALALASPAAAQGPPAPPPAPAPDPAVVATVNGEAIRLDQVDAVIRRRPVAVGLLTAAQARRLRLAVADDLIDEALLRHFLKEHGPAVDPAEADGHLRVFTASLRQQGKSPAEYFRDTGRTEAQAREAWLTLLQFNKYVEQRVTEAELRKYYDANREVFDRVTVRVAHIVARVGPAAPPGERATAHRKLAAVRAEIVAGTTDFATAARKYSVDATAPAGGDIGVIGRDDPVVDEAFARAAFALKPGEVSDPVDTEYGVHLIRVTERKAGTPSAFEKVADEVREAHADDLRRRLVAHLRKQTPVTVNVP